MLSVMDGFLLAWRWHGIGESDEDEGDVLAWDAMRLTTDADDGPSAGPASRRNGAPSLSLSLSLSLSNVSPYTRSALEVLHQKLHPCPSDLSVQVRVVAEDGDVATAARGA